MGFYVPENIFQLKLHHADLVIYTYFLMVNQQPKENELINITYQNIADETGVSLRGVIYSLKRLEERGLIRKEKSTRIYGNGYLIQVPELSNVSEYTLPENIFSLNLPLTDFVLYCYLFMLHQKPREHQLINIHYKKTGLASGLAMRSVYYGVKRLVERGLIIKHDIQKRHRFISVPEPPVLMDSSTTMQSISS